MKTIYTATIKFRVPVTVRGGSLFTVQMESTRTWHFNDIDQRQRFTEAMLRRGFTVKTDIEWEVTAAEAEEQALAEINDLETALEPKRVA